MTNTGAQLVPTTIEGVATDATTCACGDLEECYFCEPFAGMTDEEVWDEFYACPKCDAPLSVSHEEWCRFGRRWEVER